MPAILEAAARSPRVRCICCCEYGAIGTRVRSVDSGDVPNLPYQNNRPPRMEPSSYYDQAICDDCFTHFRNCNRCNLFCYNGYDVNNGRSIDRYCGDCYGYVAYWRYEPVNEPTTFYNVPSKRKFGVEIETASCNGYIQLRGKTPFGAVSDCSVTGQEFISPPVAGDKGLNVIRDFCRRAKQLKFTVDRRCGLHVHFDMSKESDLSLRHIMYAYQRTYRAWVRLVDPEREHNSYCGDNTTLGRQNYTGLQDFDAILGSVRSRYNYLNILAYNEHKTFENRLHHGSLDYNEISEWIKANLGFIEAVKDLSFDQLDRRIEGGPATFLANVLSRFNLHRLAKKSGGVPV